VTQTTERYSAASIQYRQAMTLRLIFAPNSNRS
jgi:hypothetical protein